MLLACQNNRLLPVTDKIRLLRGPDGNSYLANRTQYPPAYWTSLYDIPDRWYVRPFPIPAVGRGVLHEETSEWWQNTVKEYGVGLNLSFVFLPTLDQFTVLAERGTSPFLPPINTVK